MEKRIDLERRGRSPSQIKDLNLDNCRSTQILGLTEDFISLEYLSLIAVGLITLKGFPKLPNLKRLELSENRISGGLSCLHTSPKLTHLSLSGNKIKDIDTLQPLEEFKYLRNLDLFNCEVTKVENYRESVFKLIGSLKYLDGYDKDDKEAEDSEDEEVNDDDEDENDVQDGESDDDEDDEQDEADVYVDDEDEEEEIDEEDEDDSEGNEFNEGIDDEEDEEEEECPHGQKRKREGDEPDDD